ncbi:hypothetical protein [Halorubrum salinum]|uniref:hypothetical protein n=1 Tax=Halorubrum salinum TaxID=767517 RepID=UPI0021117C5D|nr:hypothetical protein [Halorubrum salinum]
MADIYISNGDSADAVEPKTNAAGIDRATPILELDPDRGTFLRLLNQIKRGSEIGIPVYMKLRDANGDPLPTNTLIKFELGRAGSDDEHKVSEEVKQISFWNQNDLTTQRDVDNIDNAKIELQFPEASSETGPAPFHDVRDVDSFYVSAESAAEIDWSQSEFYFDTNAVKEGSR